ncbi:MAG: 6-phosphofructokinase [Myxococcota bacterium]
MIRKIGVLTGGGDAPGLNAAIKALVYELHPYRVEVIAIRYGWEGLLAENIRDCATLAPEMVRTWDRDGGTRIGSGRYNPFNAKDKAGNSFDNSAEIVESIEKLKLDALVAMGGEDTQGVSARLFEEKGIPVVGVPKTIDLDLNGTDYTIGFWTAVHNCAETIERSRTPAGSHRWVQVIEVMGRHAGHLALWSAAVGGAQITLIPEYPFEFAQVYEILDGRLKSKRSLYAESNPGYAIVVVAEGSKPKGGELVIQDGRVDAFGHVTLGGIGRMVARRIRDEAGYPCREAVLGHPQRGGPPNETDRAMGMFFGANAAKAVVDGDFGKMVSAVGCAPACRITRVPLKDAVGSLRLVDVERQYDTKYLSIKRVQSY